jgi:hypothetical protein
MDTMRLLYALTRRLRRAGVARLILPVALLGTQLSCNADEIVEAETPDIVPPETLTGPEALPTIRGAAIGDFALAYSGSGADGSGGTEGVIMTSGLLADEWINSETFPTRIEIDRRGPIAINNGTAETWFRTLSRARNLSAVAVSRFRQYVPDSTRDVGLTEVLSLNAFTYQFFGEIYCSGVPFSTADESGTLLYGDPLTTLQMFDTSEARFNQALAAATALNAAVVGAAARTRYINFASVGLGRSLLAQGQFAAAAAAVTAVPSTFAYVMYHSENTARQNNGVFNANVINERYSVAELEGANGLPYRSAADPRVTFTRTGGGTDVGFDGITPQFDQLRYLDRRDSIPVASGVEARLIQAEAFLFAGDSVNFLAQLNGLRAAPPTYTRVAAGALPALTMPPTAVGAVDLLFRERAFWLWLTAHRLWDMRRLARAPAAGGYGRAINAVFPVGPYFKQGFTYGNDVNLPVPFDEENNPNFTACLDRNP